MNAFLVTAYALIWLALMAYVAVLGQQQKRLQQQVEALEQQVKSRLDR